MMFWLLCIFLGLSALTVKGCHTNLKGESGKFSIDKTHNGYRSNCSWTIGKGVNNIDFIVIKFTPFDLGWRCINFGQSYVEVADVNYEAKVRECGGKRPFQVLIKNRPAVVRYYTCCYAKAFFDVSFYIISQKFSGLSAKTLKPALKQTKPGVITIDWDPLKGSNADAWKPVLKQQKPVPSKNYIVVPLYNFTSKREPFLYIIESRNDTSIAVENLKPATSYTFKFIAFDSTNTRGPLIVSSTATVLTRNGTLRLMGGQLSNQGRVEIYKYGWWKKICTWNHNLNNNAASVVCRSLGLSHPTYVLNYRAFYGTSFPMHFVEDFRCTGTETSLEECSSTDPSSRCPYYLRTAAVACGYPPVFHRNISEMSGAITSPGYPWFMMQTDYRWTFTQNMTRGRVALYFEELDLRRYGGSSRVTIQESSSLSFSKTYTSEYRGKPGMVINLPGQLRFYSPYTSNRDNRDGRGMRVRFLVYNEPEGEVPTLNNWKLSLSSNHYTRITANWTQVVFTGYGIIGFVMSCNSSQDWAKEVSYAVGEGNSTSLNCSELIGYTQYNVHVLVQLRMQGKDIYKIYQSLVASLTTPQSFPRSRPPGLTSTEITLNTAIIQWQQIPRKDAHGVLLGYIVDLYSYYSDRYRGEIKTNNTSIAFTDLSPATEYYVRVKGYTAVGSGPNNYYIFYTKCGRTIENQLHGKIRLSDIGGWSITCIWRLKAPTPSTLVILLLESIEIPLSFRCKDYYMTITDGGDHLQAKLCGSRHSLTFVTIGSTEIEVYSRRPRKRFHISTSFFMLQNGISKITSFKSWKISSSTNNSTSINVNWEKYPGVKSVSSYVVICTANNRHRNISASSTNGRRLSLVVNSLLKYTEYKVVVLAMLTNSSYNLTNFNKTIFKSQEVMVKTSEDEKLGGSGLKSVEDTYKQTKIKMANYVNNCLDKRMQAVKLHEKEKITKQRRSLFKDAIKYAEEFNLTCKFNDTAGTIITDHQDTETTIATPSPSSLKQLLRDATQVKRLNEMKEQSWLAAFTSNQLEDKDMSPDANQLFRSWKNIPDVVYSVNKKIRQQLLPTRTYQQSKLQKQVTTTICRMCESQIESTSHVLSGCSKIAQSLYTARHDKMLRPVYHYLLHKYNFTESDNSKPWYQQKPPTAVIENENAKILWNTPFLLESPPEDGANKIDMAVFEKESKQWILLEGTVCQVGKINQRETLKQNKYSDLRKGIKNLYKDCSVTQINIVFDFLGGHHKSLQDQMTKIVEDKGQLEYLVQKCQKWIICQNNDIVKKFYSYI